MSKKIQNAELPLLIKKSDKLTGDICQLKQDIADLRNTMEVLTQCWSGKAAHAYLNRAQAELDRLNEFTVAAEKLSEDYCFAVSVYRADEQRAKEIFLSV